jgi:hypothetical protein
MLSARASMTRPRSPPDSAPTGCPACSGANRKSFHVADDVPPLAADDHVVAAAARERFLQRRRWIEFGAALVERGDREVCPEPHRARVRFSLAREHVEERRLADPVRPDDAQPVAPPDADGKVADERPPAQALGDVQRFQHQLARGLAALTVNFTLPAARRCSRRS